LKSIAAAIVATIGSTAMFVALAGSSSGLAVTDAWARATPPGAPVAAVYLVIDNAGGKADRLLSVSSDRAERSEVHTIVHDGDLVKMRRADPLPIGAGERVVFEPGGTHVMLMGLKSPLLEGESLALVMNFDIAGTRHVEVRVTAATSSPQAAGHHP
jgi:copper(I)-binding protein